jgi:very-short-patch-repair endonuclease
MREHPTPPEAVMWRILSAINNNHGTDFAQQVVLHGWILDFYAPRLRLCIEVDGSQHLEARHQHRDRIRDRALAKHKIKTLRFSAKQVMFFPLAVRKRVLDAI